MRVVRTRTRRAHVCVVVITGTKSHWTSHLPTSLPALLPSAQCDRFVNNIEVGNVYLISKGSLRNKRGVRVRRGGLGRCCGLLTAYAGC